MNPDLARAGIAILVGALAGGWTNAIAIWMLFHPYEPPRPFGRPLRGLQGAIPKNKPRLAAAIGRTVGTKLLTPEDLARTVSEPAFRAAFDERLSDFLKALLEREQGPLAEALPPSLADEVRSLLAQATAALAARVDAYLAGDDFRAAAGRWAETLAAELEHQPLSDLLTPEREAALTAAAERWITDVAGGEGFERAVRDYLDRSAERLLVRGRTFEELVPIGLVGALERAIAGYMPVVLERLSTLLDDPGARDKLERVLHELLDRFLGDLKFHQRLVAVLVIPPDVIDRVIIAIQEEGANKLSETMHDPAVRDAMARNINAAIVDFLRRPVDSVLGSPGDPSVEQAKDTLAGWILALARDDQSRAFVVEKLQATLDAAEHRTWGDLFEHLPPGRIADAVVAAARSERARALYREAGERVVATVLEKPIGRPIDHLPLDTPARLEAAIADPLWGWIQEQVPPLAQRIDIQRRVEQKIIDFPMQELERIIRGVTERELKLIVRLGYLLGAIIGAISAAGLLVS